MFNCPRCERVLIRKKTSLGIFWSCPGCAGRLMGWGPLRKMVPRDVLNAIWARVRDREGTSIRTCPSCSHDLLEVRPDHPASLPPLDVCRRCHWVWFDPDEFEVLPKLRQEPERQKASPRVEQAAALLKIHLEREREDKRLLSTDAPDAWWKYLPAFFGMPVEHENQTIRYLPWGTWSVGVAMVVAMIVAWALGLPEMVQQFGFIPDYPSRMGGMTLLTGFLLHGGVLHLVSNLYFLIIFGDNVEDYLGHWSFLFLIAAASLAGDSFHMLADAESHVPVIGASGGISGVIAYYALKFPRVRLGFMFRVFVFFKWFQLPAYAAFIVWLCLQFFGAWQQLAGFTQVSALAHLGGAAVGCAFWLSGREK